MSNIAEQIFINNPKILVSVVTNRGYRYLLNIINNFVRQSYFLWIFQW